MHRRGPRDDAPDLLEGLLVGVRADLDGDRDAVEAGRRRRQLRQAVEVDRALDRNLETVEPTSTSTGRSSRSTATSTTPPANSCSRVAQSQRRPRSCSHRRRRQSDRRPMHDSALGEEESCRSVGGADRAPLRRAPRPPDSSSKSGLRGGQQRSSVSGAKAPCSDAAVNATGDRGRPVPCGLGEQLGVARPSWISSAASVVSASRSRLHSWGCGTSVAGYPRARSDVGRWGSACGSRRRGPFR